VATEKQQNERVAWEWSYLISTRWDADAKVWTASSDEIPGLVAEATDIEVLIRKLRVRVPELLEANGVIPKRSGKLGLTIHVDLPTPPTRNERKA
jgi:hypothetical protein